MQEVARDAVDPRHVAPALARVPDGRRLPGAVHGLGLPVHRAAGAPGLAGAPGDRRRLAPAGADGAGHGPDRGRADPLTLGPAVGCPLQPGGHACLLSAGQGRRAGRGRLRGGPARGRPRRRPGRGGAGRAGAGRPARQLRGHGARPRRSARGLGRRGGDDGPDAGRGAADQPRRPPGPADASPGGQPGRRLHLVRGPALRDEPEPGAHARLGRAGRRAGAALDLLHRSARRYAAGRRDLAPPPGRGGHGLRQTASPQPTALHLPLRLPGSGPRTTDHRRRVGGGGPWSVVRGRWSVD